MAKKIVIYLFAVIVFLFSAPFITMNAYAGVREISFDGAHYRRDIGARALEEGR